MSLGLRLKNTYTFLDTMTMKEGGALLKRGWDCKRRGDRISSIASETKKCPDGLQRGEWERGSKRWDRRQQRGRKKKQTPQHNAANKWARNENTSLETSTRGCIDSKHGALRYSYSPWSSSSFIMMTKSDWRKISLSHPLHQTLDGVGKSK